MSALPLVEVYPHGAAPWGWPRGGAGPCQLGWEKIPPIGDPGLCDPPTCLP